jgi:hypothetical protein
VWGLEWTPAYVFRPETVISSVLLYIEMLALPCFPGFRPETVRSEAVTFAFSAFPFSGLSLAAARFASVAARFSLLVSCESIELIGEGANLVPARWTTTSTFRGICAMKVAKC